MSEYRELQTVGVQFQRQRGMGSGGRAEVTVCEPEKKLRYKIQHMKYALSGYKDINLGGTSGVNSCPMKQDCFVDRSFFI